MDYKKKRQVKGHITSYGPWDMLSVDIVGPLPRTKDGYRFVLSVMDCFSRYVILIPLWQHTAEAVSRALYENVIAYFGVPQCILSDRGAEFRGMVWESLLDLLGIKRHMTSPYYPQGNALIERMHRTLGNMLCSGLMEQDVD